MANPRTPVLVGVGQTVYRSKDLNEAKEPVLMMLDAVREAERDTGARLLADVQSVRVIRGVWSYENPARYVAEEIGAPGAQTVGTLFGGNQVQAVVNRTALEILAGDFDLVLLTGAENGYNASKARKTGVELPSMDLPGRPDLMIGSQKPEHHDVEVAKGIRQAIQVYPMYENAIRHHNGESMAAHIERVSELWSRFNDVGLRNPNAWIQTNYTAEEIRTPSEMNRPVSFPYPKLMNANNAVNMSAALVMCSVEKAKALGIPEDKWVYPHAGAQGYDHFCASVRDNFYSSPAIRLAGGRLMELAGVGPADLDFVDLYSCFPAIVQVGAKELGLEETRDLTVTGGLTFGGGPLNNYVMHSVARTVELIRERPDAKGLVTANGGNIYKHSMGIYGGTAPDEDFRYADVQDEIDALPAREVLAEYTGEITLEGYTVMYSGESPAIAHCSCLTPRGERTWANSQDADLMQAMTNEEFCGRPGRILPSGELVV
jgi:acetyl-CoA C-acetyltransferase